MLSSHDNLPALMEQAAMQQMRNSKDMERLVAQMAQIAAGFDRRLRMLEEQLSQKVTIQHAQAKLLGAAMRERSTQICAKYDLDVKACAGTIRGAIQRDVKKQFNIADLHDLPVCYYDLALRAVQEWTSFALVRKIRDKQTQRG